MNILGITNSYSFNQAACLLVDGQLVGWSEEERLIRVKHANLKDANRYPGDCAGNMHDGSWQISGKSAGSFPIHSIRLCLERAGLDIDDIDAIAVGHSKTEDVVKAYNSKEMNENNDTILGNINDRIVIIPTRMSEYLRHEARVKEAVHNLLDYDISKMEWVRHNVCHALSAIIPSEFEQCNYMSVDGDGGEDVGVFGFFDGQKINHLGSYNPCGTLGGWYTNVTNFLGFRPHSAEGKVMGLACYGEVDKNVLPEKFLKLSSGIIQPETNWYRNFFENYDEDKREEIINNPLGKTATSIAATAQNYLERFIVNNCRVLYEKTKCKNFALAGGTFLNCSMNGRLMQQDFVDNIYVTPASHDSGTAYGAALATHKKYTGSYPRNNFQSAYWGSEFTNNEIKKTLDEKEIPYEYVEDPSSKIAELLHDNIVIGVFQGRAEIGPRALCNRSIIANPTYKENLDKVNKIKRREFWRPLAPVIAQEYYHDIVDAKHYSPFMLIATPVKKAWAHKIPAVVHVDGSCRPQCVNSKQNKTIHEALIKFKKMSGVPVFLNTSFNLDDEPLVDSPEDALKTFLRSDLEALIIGNYFITK